MHWPPTNRPLTSKKFDDQKKSEFVFDINYDFKYRVFEIMLSIMHPNAYECFLTNSFLVFFTFKEGFNEKIIIKK